MLVRRETWCGLPDRKDFLDNVVRHGKVAFTLARAVLDSLIAEPTRPILKAWSSIIERRKEWDSILIR